MNNSLIYKGRVISNNDPNKEGSLVVVIQELGNTGQIVKYTSPYYNRNNGGMIAVPEIGSDVLVLYAESSNEFFYLSTIIEAPELDKRGLKDWTSIKDKYLYTERNVPERIIFTDAYGAGLSISSRLLPKFMSSKVDLTSRNGKKVSLSDSPMSDAVIIRNEHGDGMIIISEPNDIHSERSIEVKSKGAQRHVVFQSDMNFSVIDGRDITIENLSTGAFKSPGFDGRYGNINLKSSKGDINIVTKGNEGRIFLVTPKARIQIEADGTVIIESESNVQLSTRGTLDIEADKAIRIKGESLDIKTSGDIKMESGGIFSAKGSSTAYIDGSEVHFNLGVLHPVDLPQIKDSQATDYND